MKKYIFIALVILILSAAGFFVLKNKVAKSPAGNSNSYSDINIKFSYPQWPEIDNARNKFPTNTLLAVENSNCRFLLSVEPLGQAAFDIFVEGKIEKIYGVVGQTERNEDKNTILVQGNTGSKQYFSYWYSSPKKLVYQFEFTGSADNFEKQCLSAAEKTINGIAEQKPTLTSEPLPAELSEYFSEFRFGTSNYGSYYGNNAVVEDNIFTDSMLVCVEGTVAKNIKAGYFGTGIFSVDRAVGMRDTDFVTAPLNAGQTDHWCEVINLPAGFYEYKVYLGNDLVAAYLFQVLASQDRLFER